MAKLSRRKLAEHAAQRLLDGDGSVIDELSALLVSEGRVRGADVLVRDIEDRLADNGQVVVTVESAHKINEKLRQEVADIFSYDKVHIREVIRPELIGGVRIVSPKGVLDATVLGRLNALRATKL